MEYNKQQFQKTASKKVLHKVKKHWVVLSTALLVALAGSTALLGGTSAHADTASAASSDNNSSVSQTNTLKSRLNASLTQTYRNNASANTRNSSNAGRAFDSQKISNQASALHNRILANAANTHVKSAGSVSPVSQQTKTSTVGRTVSSEPEVGSNTDNANPVKFSHIPVTVKYVDPFGHLQRGANDRPLVGTAYANLAGGYGKSGHFVSDNHTYLYNKDNTPADSQYQYLNGDQPSNFTAQIDNLGTRYTGLKANDGIRSEAYDDINPTLGDNWDSTNKRPLFILKYHDSDMASDQGAPVTIKYVNANGQLQHDRFDRPYIITGYTTLAGDPNQSARMVKNRNTHVYLYHMHRGSDSNINSYYEPSDFTPADSGYQYVNGDRPSDFSVPLDSGGSYHYVKPQNAKGESYSDVNINWGDNWDSTNNRPMFILRAPDAGNINVNYINESGLSVQDPGENYVISGKGRYGDSVNIMDPKEGGYGNPYSKDYQLNSDTTKREYTFGNYPQDVTVPLTGRSFVSDHPEANGKKSRHDNYLNVNIYARAHTIGSNGQREYVEPNGKLSSTPVIYRTLHKYIGGQIGNFTIVSPSGTVKSDNTLEPWIADSDAVKGYLPSSDQQNVRIYFKGSRFGNGIMGTLNPLTKRFTRLKNNTISFTYDAGPYTGNARDIHVTYYDNEYNTKHQIASKDIKGTNKNYGRTVDVTRNSDGGLAVPQGYTLDSGQLTSYVFDSDVQNIGLMVHGNYAVTNQKISKSNASKSNPHAKPTVTVEDPLAITLERDYYSADGRTFQKKSDAVTVHPNIHSFVGQSANIDSGSFMSDVEKSDYNVTPLEHDPHVISFNSNGTVTPDHFTFKYAMYPVQAKRYKVRIHYVSVNPDGTDNLNGIDIPGTEVSDDNVAGASFGGQAKNGKSYSGDEAYRLNVPQGYQFDKVLKINGQDVSHESDPKGITNFADHDQDEVIEVVPDAGNMTIHYIDQSNHPVYTETESGFGQAAGEAPGHNSRYGELFPVYQTKNDISPVDANEVITPQGHVLNNYHISQESAGHYFTRNHQDVYVMVDGNPVDNSGYRYTAKINIHEEDPNGVVTNSYSIPDQISGDLGDSYTINADSFTPDDYVVAPGSQTQFKGAITPQGITTKSVDFYYMYNRDRQYKDLKSIDVIYEDNQQEVGYNHIDPQPGDYEGENVDVTTRASDGYQLPSGYQLDPNQNTHSTFGLNNYNQLILQVYRPDSQIEGTFTVIQDLYRNSVSRKNLIKKIYKNVPKAGAIGTSFTVDPNSYPVNGFKPVNSDSTVTSSFTDRGLNPASAEFYYVATDSKNNAKQPNHGNNNHGNPPSNPSDSGPVGPVSPTTAEPIYVQYYSGSDTSKPLGQDTRVDGYMDQTFSDITKRVPVPKNYLLMPSQQLSYTIGDREQQVDLHVAPMNAQAREFTLTTDLESPSDQVIQKHVQEIPVNGNSSDELTPSDYNPDSINFRLDTSHGRDQDINVVNKDGDLTPAKATYYYIADARHNNPNPNQPSDVNIQPITVNYIDFSDGSTISSHVLSDGYMDQKVNVTDQNLAPVPEHYHLYPSDQNVDYTFGTHPQTVDLLVSGNRNESGRDDLVVYDTLIRADGSERSGIPVNVTLQSQYGGVKTFDPQYLINKGYVPSDYHLISSQIDPSDAPQLIHFNNDGTITPNKLHFTYEQNRTNKPGQSAGVLDVKFIDKANNREVASHLIGGHKIGDVIDNVIDPSDGGVKSLPNNYTLDNSVPQNLSYKFTANDGVRNVYVIGKPDSDFHHNNLTIHRIEIHRDGSQTSSDISDHLSNDRIGEDAMVYPNEFTPKGYYVNSDDVPAKIMINNDGTLTPNQVSFIYNQETVSDAGDIRVSYFDDQNGHEIGKPELLDGAGHNNETINVTDSDPASNWEVTGDPVPQGYHLVPGQQIYYTFGLNPQNVQLRVEGDPVNSDTDQNLLTINIHEHNDKNGLHDQTQTYHMHVHEPVGMDDTISPSQYLPAPNQYAPKGYHVTNSDQVANVMMQPDHSIKPNEITWNYDVNDQQAQPLTLKYIDRKTNQQVGCTTTINGYLGQNVPNVTSQSDGGGVVPAGYTLEPNQKLNYTLGAKSQLVKLYVDGDQQNVPFIIHEVLSDGEGDIKFRTVDYRIPPKSDYVGNTYTVSPTMKGVLPNGYQTTPSDSNVAVHIGNGSLSPTCTLYHYVLPPSMRKAGPITVRFLNQEGNTVGFHTINGLLNQKVNVLHQDGDPSKPSWIPSGYNLIPGTDPHVYDRIMTKDPQYVMVQLVGQSRKAEFTVYVTKLDTHGVKVGKTTSVKVPVNGQVGSRVQITPYYPGLTPSGYHADSSDADIPVTMTSQTTSNGNGVLSPTDNTNYNYTQNYLPPNIGQINIHYVTTAGVPKSGQSDVDVLSDCGLSGDAFNLMPYKEDIPSSIQQGYHPTGHVYDHSGNLLDQYDEEHLRYQGANEQDLYVQIASNSADPNALDNQNFTSGE